MTEETLARRRIRMKAINKNNKEKRRQKQGQATGQLIATRREMKPKPKQQHAAPEKPEEKAPH